ncbi:MAG: methylated-DNA--[protein]-cysteine S-methyltransferase [Streptosporangiaceae bacterium]|jgi:methylated-DNA-[protein]-cysteine S-methyltransferase
MTTTALTPTTPTATARTGRRAHAGTGRRAHTVVGSPVGPLTLLAVDGRLAGLYLSEQRHPPAPELFGEPDAAPFAAAAGQLSDYFDGTLTSFSLPLAMAGSPFQLLVWTALQAIPYGTTISYGQLAALIGRPSAARAVGLANGRNPVSIIVPCHRVVGSDGALTGYGGGLERKEYLLALERRVAAAGGTPAVTRPAG